MVVTKLEDYELEKIEGGAIKGLGYIIAVGIGGLISLIAGIIDGYMNPIKCR